MYPVDERDTVVMLSDVPPASGGAPMPFIVADEDILLLSYSLQSDAPTEEHVAILTFERPLMHLLGPPNDEAISGHPLWRRGLESYGFYRIDQSSLLRRLSAMNYVHPRNDPASFDKYSHYILTFHDSTFECIAQSYRSSTAQISPNEDRYGQMLDMVRARDERWKLGMEGLAGKPTVRTRLGWWVRALNPWG